MLALCEKAKKKGIAGWTYPGKYPYYLPFSLYPFIGKIGGREVLDAIDNLEPNAWKDPAVKAAFEAYYELVQEGLHPQGHPRPRPHPVADRVDQGQGAVHPERLLGGERGGATTTPKDFDLKVSAPIRPRQLRQAAVRHHLGVRR